MMGRPRRVPVDLQAVTRDVKARVRRVIGDLEAIEQQQDPIFALPRAVFLELVLSIHELEAAAAKMRKAWLLPPYRCDQRLREWVANSGYLHRSSRRTL